MIKFDLLDRLLTSGYTRIPNPALDALYSNDPYGKGMTLTYILFLCKVFFADGSASLNKKVYNWGIGEYGNNQRGIANLLQTALSTMRCWLTKLVIQCVIKVENLENATRITVVCYEAITGRKAKEVADKGKKAIAGKKNAAVLAKSRNLRTKAAPFRSRVGSMRCLLY